MARRDLFALFLLLLIVPTSCDFFLDEGDRFASQVADFADVFRKSPSNTAEFVYTPKYGANQKVHYGIGRIRWCPQPPCYGQGAATVIVERGQSGTGYRIAAAASVPEPLEIEKTGEPVHVFMRKNNGDVEIVALR